MVYLGEWVSFFNKFKFVQILHDILLSISLIFYQKFLSFFLIASRESELLKYFWYFIFFLVYPQERKSHMYLSIFFLTIFKVEKQTWKSESGSFILFSFWFAFASQHSSIKVFNFLHFTLWISLSVALSNLSNLFHGHQV